MIDQLMYFSRPLPLSLIDNYINTTTADERSPGFRVRPMHQWAVQSDFPHNWTIKTLNTTYAPYLMQNGYKFVFISNFSVFNTLIDNLMMGIGTQTMREWVIRCVASIGALDKRLIEGFI